MRSIKDTTACGTFWSCDLVCGFAWGVIGQAVTAHLGSVL